MFAYTFIFYITPHFLIGLIFSEFKVDNPDLIDSFNKFLTEFSLTHPGKVFLLGIFISFDLSANLSTNILLVFGNSLFGQLL
jgi:hypothetical protein